MAVSKKDPKRKNKLKKFKQSQKMSNNTAQVKQPRTHIVEIPEWSSTAEIGLGNNGGEVLQSLIHLTREIYDKASKIGQVLDGIIGAGIKSGAVKLKKVWNNGDVPTPEEEAEYEQQKAQINEARKKEFIDEQRNLQKELKKQNNANKTGLVDTNGAPISTDQELGDEASDIGSTEEITNE